MVFKMRQTEQSSYLAELIEDVVPSRTLQSATCRQGTLKESKTALITNAKAFRYITARNVERLARQCYRLADTLETSGNDP